MPMQRPSWRRACNDSPWARLWRSTAPARRAAWASASGMPDKRPRPQLAFAPEAVVTRESFFSSSSDSSIPSSSASDNTSSGLRVRDLESQVVCQLAKYHLVRLEAAVERSGEQAAAPQMHTGTVLLRAVIPKHWVRSRYHKRAEEYDEEHLSVSTLCWTSSLVSSTVSRRWCPP